MAALWFFCFHHEVIAPASQNLLPSCLRKTLLILFLIPSITWAASPDPNIEMEPDPGLDPTVLRSRMKLTNEFIESDFGASKNTTKLNLVYAFGKPEQHDWNVQLDLPVVTYHNGNQSSPDDARGLGDIEIRTVHVFDAEGFFRWGVGAEAHFSSASEPQLGDNLSRLSPLAAFALQPCRGFTFQTTAQYDQSITTDHGVPEQQRVKTKPSILFDLPADFYGYVETELDWNLQPGQEFSSKLKLELGRGFGARNEWVVSIRYEVPLTASTENYTLTGGLTYTFP